MNTGTTVATARSIIGNLFTSGDFIPYLNQAVERIINSGLWKGTIGYTAFPTVNEYFTLPYPYLSVVGAQWFRCPVPVFSQFHEFLPGGPGQPLANMPPQGIIEDLGDGFATMVSIPTANSQLNFVMDKAADVPATFRIFGVSNGKQVFDDNGMGIDIDVTTANFTTSETFDEITGIQVPTNLDGSSALTGGWTLNSVAPDSTVTQLSYYYPNETLPSYRRYGIGVTSASNTQVPFAVTVLVRKRFMPVYKETDWVIPGNLGALKFGMQAIDSEASKNPADAFWAQCYAILNQELHAVRGAVRPEANYETLGDFAGFTNVY